MNWTLPCETEPGFLNADDFTFCYCTTEHCELAIERFEQWMAKVLAGARVVRRGKRQRGRSGRASLPAGPELLRLRPLPWSDESTPMSDYGRRLPRGWRAVKATVLTTLIAAFARAVPAQTPDATVPDANAPTNAPLAAAAATITAAELARHLGVLAADSMQGRATPSPSLERTARYVLDEFQKLGLRPRAVPVSPERFTGDGSWATDSNWVQRYSLPAPRPRRLVDGSLDFRVGLRVGGRDVVTGEGYPVQQARSLGFWNAARLAVDTVSGSDAALRKMWPLERTLVVTGRHTATSLARAQLREPVLLYVPPAGLDTAAQRTVITQLLTVGNVVVLPEEDSATFARRYAAAATRPPMVLDWYDEYTLGAHHWAAYVQPGTVDTLLARGGFDVAQARADTVPRVQEVRSLDVSYQLSFAEGRDTMTGINVLGVIPGRDSVQKHSFVVYAAALDGAGSPEAAEDRRAPGDTLVPGTPSEGSALAGLLALAKAFSQPEAQPRHSVLLLATSGRGHHFAGVRAFTQWFIPYGDNPAPLTVTLGPLGRDAGDTLPVAGLTELDFPTRPEWLTARHPELGLTVIDGGTVVSPVGEHFAFVARSVASLYVATGTALTGTAPRATESMDFAARALRFAFYLGQDVANGPRWPRWTSAARAYLGR